MIRTCLSKLSPGLLLFLLAHAASAAPVDLGGLTRRSSHAVESHGGVVTEYGALRVSPDVRLRTFLTRPEKAAANQPAVLFVGWLSCDTVEIEPRATSGWSRMLEGLIRRSNAIVMRVDKRGVGDSEGGPCSALDYNTELADYRLALAELKRTPGVDPGRVVVFGASMGGTMAPLLAGDGVAGVMDWGAGALTWLERTLAFERNALQLSGKSPALLDQAVRDREDFLHAYLVRGESPAAIAAAQPRQKVVWESLVGVSGELHYGRPPAFHQQAQQQSWAAAWSRVRVPAIVLYGSNDWFEEPRGFDLISAVNPNVRVVRIPGLDHHFTRYGSLQEAFADKGGPADADAALNIMLPWLATTFSQAR
ncbi:MAG TPA: alpha/beta hydrolase [Lysobacter sp.]|nr:alpha/beta hydrolase [Lysobacter sp.]